MPPWKPVDGGPFLHERRLSKDELALLARWADAGAPPGDLSKAPPAPKFAEGWMLGTPDLILEAPEYEFTAEGDDEWRCFVLPKEFTDETWVSAIELRPGNPKAVHHIVVWLDRTGRSLKLDDADPRPGWKTDGTGPGFAASGEMGGWAPGNLPYRLPEGVARELKRGTRIVLDIHYHKGGRAGRDKTVLGLHFAKAPVKQALLGRHLINHNFRIPPGAERHKVVAFQTMTEDSHTLSLMPHMHYLGRELKVEALFPDDTRRTLVHITDWDFNGQDTYLLREPVALPRGTKVRLEAIYDNSEKNPNNPNRPPIAVRWGERTTDEMCVAFLWYTKDAEDRTKTEAAPRD